MSAEESPGAGTGGGPGDGVADRLPTVVWVAPLVPSFLLGAMHVLGRLGVGVPHVAGATLLVLWVCTTVPMVLLAVGLRDLARRLRGADLERDMAATANAITWAEGIIERARVILDEADAVILRRPPAEPDAAPPPTRRRFGWGAVAAVAGLLALSGVASYALLSAPEPPEQVHLHAAFAVYVQGERVDFTDPYFDLTQSGFLRAHLHVPDQDVMHVEGAPGLSLEEFFRLSLRAELDQGALRLDDAVHGGLTVRTNATHALRLYVAPDGGGAWTQVLHIPGYVMHDHDRILVTYGDEDGDALTAQLASVARTFPEA